jgi:hypothetical protein
MGVIAKRGLYFLLSYCVTARTWTLNRNFQQCTQQREEITTVVSVSSSALAPPPPPPPHLDTRGGSDTLACGGGGGGSQLYTLWYTRYYYAAGTPCVSSEQLTHKKCAKMYFCEHWQHLLVGAEVQVAPTSMCWNNLSCVITSCSAA